MQYRKKKVSKIRFVIVDDDPTIIKMIKNIITEYNLGTVLATCTDGISGEKTIRDMLPDIAIVDLLMPGQDGVTMIKQLQNIKSKISFVIISESRSQTLLTMAYEQGIEYYIHKPINVVEVVSVLKKTDESRKLKQFMTMVSNTATQINKQTEKNDDISKRRIYNLFYDLGIIGDVGTNEVYRMIRELEMLQHNQKTLKYQLSAIYTEVAKATDIDTKTIEQRVRRTIAKALVNVASLGLEDFYNEKFQEYNNVLFDFKEVRQEMIFMQKKSAYRGKINIRKFIEGILFITERHEQ